MVIESREDVRELLLDDAEVTVRELAVVEFAVVDSVLHEAVDQRPDALGARVREDARRGFHGVRQHRHTRLLALRLRAGVGEVARIHFRDALLGARLLEEVADELRAVVLPNEILHDLGQARFLRHNKPVAHMVAQDLGALPRRETVVRVQPPRLVLDEILRTLELPDVVVVDPHAALERVGPDRLARRFDEVRHVDRVGVRAGRLARQPPQKRPVHVGEFEQRRLRRASRERLEQREADADAESSAYGGVEKAERRGRSHLAQHVVAREDEQEAGSHVGRGDQRDEHPTLRARADRVHRKGRRDPPRHGHHGGRESREVRLAHENPRDRRDDHEAQQAVEQRRGEEAGQRDRHERRRAPGGGHGPGRRHHDDDEPEQHGEAGEILVHVAAEAERREDENSEHAHDEEDHAHAAEEVRCRARSPAPQDPGLIGEESAVILLRHHRVLGDDALSLEHEAFDLGDRGPGLLPRLPGRVLVDAQRRLSHEDELLEERRAPGRQPVSHPLPCRPREVAEPDELPDGAHPVVACRPLAHDDVHGADVREFAPADHTLAQALEGHREFIAQLAARRPVEEVLDLERVDHPLGREVDPDPARDLPDLAPDERGAGGGRESIRGDSRLRRGNDGIELCEEGVYALDAAVRARRLEPQPGRHRRLRLVLLLPEAVRILGHVEIEVGVDRLPGDAAGVDAVEPGRRALREHQGDGEGNAGDHAGPESVVDPRVPAAAGRRPVHGAQVVSDAAEETQRSDSRYARMISFTSRCRTTSASSR